MKLMFPVILDKIKKRKASKEDLINLGSILKNLDEKTRKEIAYIAAKYSIQKFPELFFTFAKEIYGSIWYVKLMGEAIYLSNKIGKPWMSYYVEGLKAIENLPSSHKGLGYIFLANYAFYADKEMAKALLTKALEFIDEALEGIIGGIILHSIRLAKKLEMKPVIDELIKKISYSPQLTLFEKVDLLAEIVENFGDDSLSIKALKLAVTFASRISNDELFKMAVVIIYNAAKKIDDIHELKEIAKGRRGLLKKALDDVINIKLRQSSGLWT